MQTRKHVVCVVAIVCGVLIGVAMAATAPPRSTDSEDLKALADARLKVIAKVFQFREEMHRSGQDGHDPEYLYVWSRRWLDTQRELSDKRTDHVDAFETHLERMRQSEALERQKHRAGEATMAGVLACEFYRLEAEYWLAQAKAK